MKPSLLKLFCTALLFVGLSLALAAGVVAQANENHLAPDLPTPQCDSIKVLQGHQTAFRTYARGVQIYRWEGASWVLPAPEAELFATHNFRLKVGTHYAGPTWDNGFGKVIGYRVASCSPNPTAIPWLLLKVIWTKGYGPFSKVTYIQRINTVGGLAPAMPGTAVDEVVEVPYTAEYVFYRANN